MAEKTLKDQNRLGLALVVSANLIVLIALAATNTAPSWPDTGRFLTSLLPGGIGVILVGVLNAQLGATAKARLVYVKWDNPMPASCAFSMHGPKDERVDMPALKLRLGELPTDPAQQNSTWYRLYREVADKPAVLHANKEYLFTRDYYVLSIGMLLALGIASFWAVELPVVRAWYAAGLFLQVLITGNAARTHGKRLVCNVLALSTPLIPQSQKAGKKKK